MLDRCRITAQSGTTITYTNTDGSTYDGTNGYGYFIQNDPRTLDQTGEWYFNNSTKMLQMYFAGAARPGSYLIKASCIDTLLNLNAKSYITISNLVFDGANRDAIYGVSCSNVTIRDCDFTNAGVGAINLQTAANLLIENCTTTNILSNAIRVNSTKSSNVTIRNCQVNKTGIVPGMGQSSGNSYKGILALAYSNLLIEYNRVDTTGYVGIEFQGSNVTVKNNVVNYFDFVKDDAGGIYSYASGTDANPGTIYTNRVVRDNIVMNGIGAAAGRSTATLYATGIYLDGRTMNVDVLNNTVFNHPRGGIHSNNPNNVNIKGNTSYNNLNGVSIFRWAWGGITNLAINNNILYPVTDAQRTFYYTNSGLNEPVTSTVQAALTALGNVDSNYYNMVNPVGFNAEVYATTGGALVPTSPMSLEAWRSFSGHDNNSKKPAKSPVGYKVNSLTGTNKFTNGLFTANITGITLYGTNTSVAWDNTGKISGGSLKVTFSSPVANKYILLHSPIGAVSAAKKYILRFSTFGTTQQGIVRAYIRKTTSPYNNLTAVQYKSFGTGRKDHEFLFDAPTTDAGGSFVIELEQNSGTTYLDNVEFYEADATTYDTNAQVRFEYNDTKVAKTVTLNGIYTAVDGTGYVNTSITLQPYSSIILVRDTSSRIPLTVSATFTPVKCFGDNSTATITATGGTVPYSGTGVFVIKAGTFTYVVRDANGDTASVSFVITQPAAPLEATATAEVITVAGGTTTVNVAATGGTAPYTGTGSFTVTAGSYTYPVTDANGCATSVSITVADANGPLNVVPSQSTVNINCFGGSSTVNINAIGGQAPYSGNGQQAISAGKGSLRVGFNSSISGAYTLVYYTVGAISASKNYVLRFTTLGTTGSGKLRASIRQTHTPFTTLTAKQSATFGTVRKDHEFRFIAPPTESAASFLIELDQSSGTTYIDNIAFFEVDASGNLKGTNMYDGQFEKNLNTIFAYSSNSNHSLALDTTAKITATRYFTVTDALNASAVAVVNTTQPATALKATATATAINPLVSSFSTITVAASGGTAPYTGAGTYSVTAGTYSYTVTDAKGCTARVTITTSTSTASASSRPLSSGTATAVANTDARLNNAAADDALAINNLQLMAYPNPTNSSFNLLAQGGSTERISIEVFGFDGKLVYRSGGVTNTRYSIGANFMPGVYVVKVTQGSTTRLLKVVKANN